jgi:hypothetical protein
VTCEIVFWNTTVAAEKKLPKNVPCFWDKFWFNLLNTWEKGIKIKNSFRSKI